MTRPRDAHTITVSSSAGVRPGDVVVIGQGERFRVKHLDDEFTFTVVRVRWYERAWHWICNPFRKLWRHVAGRAARGSRP